MQGFPVPKICPRISCFLQIKLSLNPDSAGLSFPCILSKPSCTLRLCGNPIFWKLSKSASASYPPSAELSTFPKTTKVQLSVGPFSYFIFASEADLADLLQGCFGAWHLINSVRNLPLATCPAGNTGTDHANCTESAKTEHIPHATCQRNFQCLASTEWHSNET